MSSALTRTVRSTSFRIAALFVAIFVGSTLLIGVLFHWRVQNHLENQARAFVEALALDARAVVEASGIEVLAGQIEERARREPYSREIWVLFDEDHEPIAGAPQRLPRRMLLSDFPRSAEAKRGRIVTDFPNQFNRRQPDRTQGADDGRRGRRSARQRAEDDDAVFVIEQLPFGAGTLLIVRLAGEMEEMREFVRGALLASAGSMLLLGLFGALLLNRVVERKLERLNLLSHDIRHGDLTRRIPSDGSGDEFDHLAANLNAMLDRIAELLEASRQVTNDIAHDLRTPLTRMRTRIEALREHPQGAAPPERVTAIEQVLEDSDNVLRIFDSLLRIAGVESGSAAVLRERVAFSEVVEDVVELYEPLAEEKELSWTRGVTPNLEVLGDRQLLSQAVANVIENAIKYTPTGGSVRITLEAAGRGTLLVVEDSGPGVPAALQERVFGRFYRLEKHRSTPGHGLGLSLVRAIVQAHDGAIRLASSDPGLRLMIELPRL